MIFNRLSWAGRRRAVVFLVLGIIASLSIVLVYHVTVYRAPSCTDGIQNQNETGIDCGGSCTYLCTAQVLPPLARFVRPIENGVGRTDIVAYVDNSNATAALRNASYTIQLYGKDNTILSQKNGTVDLPPHSAVPVFIPDFYNGPKKPVNAFLTFKQSSLKWFTSTTSPQTLPISDIKVASTDTPHITATVTNPTATPLYNVKIIIVVLGASGSSDNVIAASQTVVPLIPAQGTAPLIFTWNAPFSGAPVREEILPVLPLAGP